MTSKVSTAAYRAIPNLAERQSRVYSCIVRNENVSANDIARIEKMTAHNVRCRINELLDAGEIVRTGRKTDHITGYKNNTYAAVDRRFYNDAGPTLDNGTAEQETV